MVYLQFLYGFVARIRKYEFNDELDGSNLSASLKILKITEHQVML